MLHLLYRGYTWRALAKRSDLTTMWKQIETMKETVEACRNLQTLRQSCRWPVHNGRSERTKGCR